MLHAQWKAFLLNSFLCSIYAKCLLIYNHQSNAPYPSYSFCSTNFRWSCASIFPYRSSAFFSTTLRLPTTTIFSPPLQAKGRKPFNAIYLIDFTIIIKWKTNLHLDPIPKCHFFHFLHKRVTFTLRPMSITTYVLLQLSPDLCRYQRYRFTHTPHFFQIHGYLKLINPFGYTIQSDYQTCNRTQIINWNQ